jgi:hypothetical protein
MGNDMNNLFWYEGKTVALVVSGRKYDSGLIIEADGLRTIKIPKGERLAPVMYHGKPYPRTRAIRAYRKVCKLPGTTKGSRKLFRRMAA